MAVLQTVSASGDRDPGVQGAGPPRLRGHRANITVSLYRMPFIGVYLPLGITHKHISTFYELLVKDRGRAPG